jgi:2,3-bisphosphoglycerate-independent phosphoglycerate mutase
MKYVILIGDGMADYPIPEHGGKTALQIANTPNLDFIATQGFCGLVRTIPAGMGAGSDIATLSILGYDPALYYTGRGPLEAMGMHIPLDDEAIAFRCNLITEAGGRIVDYSGGHIKDEEARELIGALNEEFSDAAIKFYPGVSYRNVLVLKSKELLEGSAPPHDIIGAQLEENLAKEGLLRDIVLTSRAILEKHEINIKRAARNEKRANMVWLWSGGKKPVMPAFSELYGVSGSVVSGVYLIKGIGRCAGMDILDVPGATGYFDTNYKGKVEYALRSLRTKDFVLVHVEAPDEAAHIGDLDMKVKAIEDFDALVVGKVLKGLADEFAGPGYKILAMPDHYTPVSVGTHTREPVPFAIFSPHAESKMKKGGFDETTARKGELGLLDARAQDLMRLFFRN